MNLKAFMKEDLKDRGTMEFPGIERFTDEKGKPIPFIIKRLSRKEIKEIRELYETKQVFRDKNNGNRPIISGNGQVAIMRDYDSDSAGRHIMVEAFVQPKLDAPELMEYYGVLDRLDMPSILFPNKEEMEYADECLMIACGLKSEKSEKEVIDDVKN